MSRPRVLLTNAIDPSGMAILEPEAEVVIAPDTKPETLKRLVVEADALMVRAFLPADLFDTPNRLRGVVRHGVGLDMIPMDGATKHGIPVANVPGSNAEAVAEYAIGAMVSLARRLHVMDRELRAKDWNPARKHSDLSTELLGRTLGIVGFGNVGARAAEIAALGFRMKVLATASRSRPAPAHVQVADLDRLFRESDYVLLSCPLTDETKHLVNAACLATMKPSAMIVNAARGPVIDEKALVEALKAGRLRGAALDVYETQPVARDHALLAMDNVLLTPHAAGITEDSMKNMSQGAARDTVRLLRFERPENFCNPEVWNRHLARFGRTA